MSNHVRLREALRPFVRMSERIGFDQLAPLELVSFRAKDVRNLLTAAGEMLEQEDRQFENYDNGGRA